MLILVVFLIVDMLLTSNTYKALEKKRFKKSKKLYISLSLIYYVFTLSYIGGYVYLTDRGVVIHEALLLFFKMLLVVSFLFDISLKLSIQTGVKKLVQKKTGKRKKSE